MAGGTDPDNRHDFPGGWKEDPRNAFTKEGRTPAQEEIFEYVRALLQLRREHPALRGGRLWHLAVDDDSYVFLRESDEETLVVAFHKGATEKALHIPLRDTAVENATTVQPIFGDGEAEINSRVLRVRMPGDSVSIFEIH